MRLEDAMNYGYRLAGREAMTAPIEPLKSALGRQIESSGAGSRGAYFQSARSNTPSSFATAIAADVGESQAYMRTLENGEFGLARPQGSNAPGVDFITFRREADGNIHIYLNDAKTRISAASDFPTPDPAIPPSWIAEMRSAVSPENLYFGDLNLEAEIRRAVEEKNRFSRRQINIDMSEVGGGRIWVP